MSDRSKGMAYEREFEKILQKIGYTTQRVKGATRFNLNVDFFGIWDIIAFDKAGWLLAQVKTRYETKYEDEMKDWFEEHQPPMTTAIYMIRKKGVRIKNNELDRWEMVYIGQNGLTKILPIKEKVKRKKEA